MKIWLLTTEYPPSFGGGISTYCKNTADMFSSFGHEVTVFTNDDTINDRLVIEERNKVIEVRFKPGNNEIYKYIGYIPALSFEFADIVEEHIKNVGKPDIIEFQEYLGIGYFLLHRKKELHPIFIDIPMVTYMHTPKFMCDKVNQYPLYNYPDYWIGEMEKYCIKAANMVISPSKFLVIETSKEMDLDPDKVIIIRNPYKPNIKKDGKFEFNRNEIVFFGRMEYRKGLKQLVKILAKLWDNGLELPLKVVGGDTFFQAENMTIQQSVEKKYKEYVDKGLIIFEGKLSPDNVQERLQTSGLIIVPSLFENYPYTVIEAMSNKKIVCVSETGGHSEIIDYGKNGYIYNYSDGESLKRIIEEVLKLSDDELMNIGCNALKKVESISSFEAVYNQKIKAFEHCVENAKKANNKYPFIRAKSNIINADKNKLNFGSKLLSIVIPYYNMGRYIDDALDSLSKIDYKRVEIIIVNDGSNDIQSIKKLEEVKAKYHVKVLNKENGGLAQARNEGAKIAQGEFLTFLDADDMVEDSFYSKAIKLLEYYNNVSFIGCWAKYFDVTDSIWVTWDPEPPYFLVHNSLVTGALVYRTKCFKEAGMNDEIFEYGMEDYESTISMISKGFYGVVITEPLFLYRVRKDSMSRGFNKSNRTYLNRLISRKHKNFYSIYADEIYNLLDNNGPSYLSDNPTWNYPNLGFISDQKEQAVEGAVEKIYIEELSNKEMLEKVIKSTGMRTIFKEWIKHKIRLIFN